MNSSSSTMNEEPDALSVVNQLRDLAADPLNRRAIVQDQGCLPGLILFMDHPNPPVVHSALLALRYLAECRANREKMKGELGMMLSLQNVIQKCIFWEGDPEIALEKEEPYCSIRSVKIKKDKPGKVFRLSVKEKRKQSGAKVVPDCNAANPVGELQAKNTIERSPALSRNGQILFLLPCLVIDWGLPAKGTTLSL